METREKRLLYMINSLSAKPGEPSADNMLLDTLPKMLRRNYQRWGDRKIAMRVKVYGQWTTYTWKDYYEKVKYLSLGLISLGLESGDKVAILGENKPEWFWAELAVQSARAATAGVYTDCTANEVKHFVTDSEAKFIFCHDQEQVDKMLQIKHECPLVQKIIYWDIKGLWGYDDPVLTSFDDVLQLGEKYEKLHLGLFEDNIEKVKAEDIAVIVYTSGTTGLPKGVTFPHGRAVQGFGEFYLLDGYDEDDEYFSFIPPAWGTEQMLGLGCSLISGMKVNFSEEPETVQENIREIAPNVIFYGAKLWENVVGLIQAKMMDSSALRRALYNAALNIGYKVGDMKTNRTRPSWYWRILHWLADVVVFRALKDKVGLLKIEHAYIGGAAISPDILRYFQAIGVNIKQVYGLSEVGGLATAHRDDDIQMETSGTPVPEAEVRITKDGEILTRAPYQATGYYKKPEATRARYAGGWCHTADFGHLTEGGHLIVIDRMEDVSRLAGGEVFSPQYCEIRLRFSPFINDVIVVGGEDKAFASAIVTIDLETVGQWAEKRNLPYTTFADLSQKVEVIELITGEIEKVNRTLPASSRIKRFVNLHKPFDPDEAEITRSRKIRRDFIEQRYTKLIGGIYGGDNEVIEETLISYRDGRKGVSKMSVRINTLK